MARARTTMPRRRRQSAAPRRIRADWVYRPNLYDTVGGSVDTRGSYTSRVTLVPAGAINASGKVLYDSKMYLMAWAGVVPLVGAGMNMSARAEGARPHCLAVRGHVVLSPSTWALGNLVNICLRLMVSPQDSDTGAPLVQDAFNAWFEGADTQDQAATMRNSSQILREWRVHRGFNADVVTPLWTIPINARVNRRLGSDECLWLYAESSSAAGLMASVGVNMIPWLSTLVRDEG